MLKVIDHLNPELNEYAKLLVEDLKYDLWYLMETDQFSVVKKKLQEKWLTGKPWRIPKKKRKEREASESQVLSRIGFSSSN